MKLSSLIMPAVVVALGFTQMAQAQNRLDQIKETHTIKIGHRDSSIPFSYLDGNKPIGYHMDICAGIVDALEKKLNTKLDVKLVPITPATRIPVIANGTVDMICGDATNNAERQKEVSFAPATFVTSTRFVSRKGSGYKTLEDFKGLTVTSTAGTSNLKWLTQTNATQKLGMQIVQSKDHPTAFQLVEQGRAKAFFMDDILLAGLVANSHNPSDWVISDKALTIEPYGIILPKNEPEFKQIVDEAVIAMMKDGTVEKLYNKWFMQPIPPKNINLNMPMSAALKKVIEHPTDSPDPKDYE